MVDPNLVMTYTIGKEGFIVALCESLGVTRIIDEALTSNYGRPLDIPYSIDALLMLVNMCYDHRPIYRLAEFYKRTDLEGIFHYPISLSQINDDRLGGFAKRWKIEVFYSNAKQELRLTSCHSKYKEAHEAHIEMIFMVVTMLCYANWELNKDGAIILTHGQIVHEIINASHRISKKKILQVYFDTAVAKYTSFFKKFWGCRTNKNNF